LSDHNAEIAEKIGKDFQRALLEELPDLAAACVGGASSSFSATLQIDKSKDGFRATLKTRVRLPDPEALTYDLRLDDDQLKLDLG
jgi:hypothetical protein